MADELVNPYVVKLIPANQAGVARNVNDRVTFIATPDLSENQTVNYSTIEPVHMPGQIFVYKNTTSRTFNLSNLRLISRTPQEADVNLRYLHLLRSWTKPRFGINSSTLSSKQSQNREALRIDPTSLTFNNADDRRQKLGTELLGAPPPVLLLSAYSSSVTGTTLKMEHIRRVPVVIQTLNIPYPSDIDYINSTSGVPMPTIMTIDVTLAETHSPREYERFSIDQYKAGILPNF